MVYFEIYFLFRCILIAFESVDNKLQVCFRAWSLFFMRASRPNSCIFVKTNSRSTSKSEREIPADILLAYNKVSPFKSGIYAPNSSNLLNGDICIRSIVMFVSKSADSSFMPMYLTLSCMLGIDNKI